MLVLVEQVTQRQSAAREPAKVLGVVAAFGGCKGSTIEDRGVGIDQKTLVVRGRAGGHWGGGGRSALDPPEQVFDVSIQARLASQAICRRLGGRSLSACGRGRGRTCHCLCRRLLISDP